MFRSPLTPRKSCVFMLLILAVLMLAGCGPDPAIEQLAQQNEALMNQIDSEREQFITITVLLAAVAVALFIVGTGLGSKLRRDRNERHDTESSGRRQE